MGSDHDYEANGVLVSVLSGLATLLLLGAAFGATGVWARQRLGPRAVLALWVLSASVVAAVGTIRAARLERAFNYQPARQHPLWVFGLFAAFFLLALAPAAFSLARGDERSRGRGARRSALLVLPGLVIAILVGLALDISGVNFLPPP